MVVDSFDYIACYKGLHPNLDTAIEWLNSHTLDALENGKTIIDGDKVFVNVMDADLRDAEGHIHTPEQAVQALYAGAFALVVGGAITRPAEITARYTAAINNHK